VCLPGRGSAWTAFDPRVSRPEREPRRVSVLAGRVGDLIVRITLRAVHRDVCVCPSAVVASQESWLGLLTH
jgi:hypothetical protein